MADTIELRDVRAYGRHGAQAGERERAQPFDLALRIEIDLAAARHSDVLADTLDYAALHATVLRIVGSSSYSLLERLGAEVLATIMSDPRVLAAEVTIAKPRLLAGATPAVTVRARRNSCAVAEPGTVLRAAQRRSCR